VPGRSSNVAPHPGLPFTRGRLGMPAHLNSATVKDKCSVDFGRCVYLARLSYRRSPCASIANLFAFLLMTIARLWLTPPWLCHVWKYFAFAQNMKPTCKALSAFGYTTITGRYSAVRTMKPYDLSIFRRKHGTTIVYLGDFSCCVMSCISPLTA